MTTRTAQALYKKLLTFYPRVFRERFGASMEQTFTDLFNERKQQAGLGLFGFVLWMFVETATGIVQEHILSIKEMNFMKTTLTNVSAAAVISFLIVLPFMVLELATRTDAPRSRLSFIGFVNMWLLPMVCILILMPIVRAIRAGNNVSANPFFLLLRVVVVVILAWTWGGFIIDQWPCFLGATGC